MKKLLVFTLILFLINCSRDEINYDLTQKTGIVKGSVIANNNNSLASIYVFFDINGDLTSTFTDYNGNFELEIPVGTGKLYIQSGNGKIFRTVKDISIAENQVIEFSGTESLRLNQVANLGYLRGDHDTIQDLVVELGYSVSEVNQSDLASSDLINNYNAIFLNCDLDTFSTDIDDNLTSFVAQGGSLYASDWGIGYYIGEDPGSTNVCGERPGGFISDDTICAEKTGLREPQFGSPVISNELQTVLGKSTMDIDSGIWTEIHSTDTDFWETLVEDPEGNPLVIKTNKVTSLITNLPNNNINGDWVTICHIPPGNPDNAHTITINANALDAHLAHGDVIGECNSDTNSGNVYYTTFENHQSGPSAIEDVKKILGHIILSL